MKSLLADERGSWSLIGLLAAVAILFILIAVLYLRVLAPKTEPGHAPVVGVVEGSNKQTVPGLAMDAAKNAECRTNLNSIRTAISAYQAADPQGAFPPSLEALRSFGVSDPQLLKCALGGEPYAYDPRTGSVRCTHSGHEKF